MTTWADGPMVAFDLESTGVDTETARIVTASMVVIQPGRDILIEEWLVNPGIEIPAEATAVHGITTEHAREHGIGPVEALLDIQERIAETWKREIPLAVYNAPYDITLTDRELRRHTGLPLGEIGPVIDPLVLDRAMDPYRRGSGTRKLTYVCQKVYNVKLSDEDAHGSTADALAAARVAWKIAKQYPECGELKLDELQTKQAEWHRLWAQNFNEYRVKQGKPADVELDWPIRPFVEPALFDRSEVKVCYRNGGLL